MVCRYSAKELGMIDMPFELCSCPVESPCGIGLPVKTNDDNYHVNFY